MQVANNMFCIGWSKETGGVHLIKMSLTTLAWKQEIDFLEYIV